MRRLFGKGSENWTGSIGEKREAETESIGEKREAETEHSYRLTSHGWLETFPSYVLEPAYFFEKFSLLLEDAHGDL